MVDIDERTPLQAVVSVLCDALCELPATDQSRALEAVHVTLGISRPAVAPTPDATTATTTLEMLGQLLLSLRSEQLQALSRSLDMTQQLLFLEIAEHVLPRAEASVARYGPTAASLPDAAPTDP